MMKMKSKFKIKSLKWQLLFRFLMILVILLVTIGVFQYISMREYLYETKSQVLQQKFHTLDLTSLSKENANTITSTNAIKILNKLRDKRMTVSLIDKNGEALIKINNSGAKADDKDGDDDSKEIDEKKMQKLDVPVLSEEDYTDILNQYGNLEHTFKIVKDKSNNYQMVGWVKVGDLASPCGLIQLSTPIDDITAILMRQIYVHVSTSILILVIGGILGTTIFKRTLKPLYNITDTVEGIGVTDLDKRLKEENGQLEIDRLAKSFNVMLTRIQESFMKEQAIKEKMRRFVSDASHELRTPLTSIHGFVEILLRGAAKNKEQLDLALNSILLESERLTKLVNDLLILTKLDQKPVVEMKKENINELISEIKPQLQILSKGRELQFQLKDNIEANINKDQIKQVIFNLTQNAVLHTDKEKGAIIISTNVERVDNKEYAVLKVTDNGTGIPKEDITKIYDRFFRSEAHRSREHGGYGLGLSIVKSIIDSNGGKIKVESEVNVGTTFSVYLRMDNELTTMS